MKKALAREFLWFLLSITLAFPLGLLFLWLLGFSTEQIDYSETEKDYLLVLYLIGYIVSLAGIYLIRTIISAIQVVADNSAE